MVLLVRLWLLRWLQGALQRTDAQVALSITGVAGPTGGTEAKPVGMVCFAWAVVEINLKLRFVILMVIVTRFVSKQ